MIKEVKVETVFVKSEYNVVDGFTKALGRNKFDHHSRFCFERDFVEAQGRKEDKLGGSIMPARVFNERIAIAYEVVRKSLEDQAYNCCLCLLR